MSRTVPTTSTRKLQGPRGGTGGRLPAWRDRVIEWVLWGCGSLPLLTTLAILVVLLTETVRFFADVSLAAFLFDTDWAPLLEAGRYGIWPLVTGTLLTTGIAMLVAIPLGLLCAIYLSEFAPRWARRLLRPSLELLSGIPTVVYGYLALVFVTPALQRLMPSLAGFNALSPGIVLGVMVVPMISSLSEEALAAVPQGVREAAYGLGSTKLSTIFRVVLPAATSGVTASIVLAGSRAVGETMIVAVAAGQEAQLTLDPRVPIETMTAYIVKVSMGDVPSGTVAFRTVFAVGAVLFVVTLLMNAASQRLMRRFRGR